jgi:ABC-type Fe3+-hydroxamate transport system substrate-binding protein
MPFIDPSLYNGPPRRIVSLVPSQTELLHYLGLEETVAGITKFCVHPAHWFRGKIRVGGTKQLHIDVIDRLQPGLILANKEENVKEQVEALAQRYPVYVSDVNNFEDACGMIAAVGQLVNQHAAASLLVNELRQKFGRLAALHTVAPVMAAYLIWRDPYMTAGGDTFINSMLSYCGLQNVFAHQERYPVVTVEELRASQCKVVLLSSEPFPFKEKHIAELAAQLPGVKIILANGEMFSWYGSRMLLAADYFFELSNSKTWLAEKE